MNTTNSPTSTSVPRHSQRYISETLTIGATIVDYYPKCPNCGRTLLTKATRPWTNWCRDCKRDYDSPD